MHHTERGVAGGDVVDEHPQRAQVEYLLEARTLGLHLAPDAVDVLRAAAHLGPDALGAQRPRELAGHLFDVAFAVRATLVEAARDVDVGRSVELAKREILELGLEVANSEAARKRRVDLETLSRDVGAQLRRAGADPAHEGEALRQSDQQHAGIFGERYQQLARALDLGRVRALACVLAVPILSEAAHALRATHQVRDGGGELFRDGFGQELLRFDRGEQQPGGEGVRVEAQLGEDECGVQAVPRGSFREGGAEAGPRIPKPCFHFRRALPRRFEQGGEAAPPRASRRCRAGPSTRAPRAPRR